MRPDSDIDFDFHLRRAARWRRRVRRVIIQHCMNRIRRAAGLVEPQTRTRNISRFRFTGG
jgi:hypothetical protein